MIKVQAAHAGSNQRRICRRLFPKGIHPGHCFPHEFHEKIRRWCNVCCYPSMSFHPQTLRSGPRMFSVLLFFHWHLDRPEKSTGVAQDVIGFILVTFRRDEWSPHPNKCGIKVPRSTVRLKFWICHDLSLSIRLCQNNSAETCLHTGEEGRVIHPYFSLVCLCPAPKVLQQLASAFINTTLRHPV